ncbi:hypothetical protein BC831DRAFT_552858 [Entophlyctis helioformis]|nr:hypothetical protein BC831DRAFT_552858 [Entophlyctis helioformis]
MAARPPSKPVTLDVGGRLFRTSPETLASYPTSLLGRLFHPSYPVPALLPDDAGHYFIDRNPDYFAVILDFLRTGMLVVPPALSRAALDRELDFYGLLDIVEPAMVDQSALLAPYFPFGVGGPAPAPFPLPLPLPLPAPSGAPLAADQPLFTSSSSSTAAGAPSSGLLPQRQSTPAPGQPVQLPTSMSPTPQLPQPAASSPAIAPTAGSDAAVQSVAQQLEAVTMQPTASASAPARKEPDLAATTSPAQGGIYVHQPAQQTGSQASVARRASALDQQYMSGADPALSFAARRQGFEDSWATAMACRASPILSRAISAGLLRFTVFIDPYGRFKGVPAQLNAVPADALFWQDFAWSFAAAPPGSVQDFSQSFREHFNVTLTPSYPSMMRLPGHTIAVVGSDVSKPTQESEAVSWVVFRVKTVRNTPHKLPFVDRTGMDGSVSQSSAGVVLLHGWELHFNMPETLTASKLLLLN